MAKCAFLGLGVMGFPMAGHLRSQGHDVSVWNRTESRAEHWNEAYGPGAKASAAEAVVDAEFVMICVGQDRDVLAVVESIGSSLKPGCVVIDHTTASPACAKTVASSLSTCGVDFLDAPISGGQSGAEAGTLSVMCGGASEVFDRCEPVMRSYGRTITRVGETGAGQTAKCVNQICIAGTLLGLAEGLRFAEAAGLDADALLQAIGSGAAQSWQMQNRLTTMAERRFDFGFALDWMRKDLGIALEAADTLGVDLPTTRAADSRYAALQNDGDGRLDTSAIIKALDAAG